MIEQARFTYSPLGKAFDKQIKTTEDQGKAKEKQNLLRTYLIISQELQFNDLINKRK